MYNTQKKSSAFLWNQRRLFWFIHHGVSKACEKAWHIKKGSNCIEYWNFYPLGRGVGSSKYSEGPKGHAHWFTTTKVRWPRLRLEYEDMAHPRCTWATKYWVDLTGLISVKSWDGRGQIPGYVLHIALLAISLQLSSF